jgi:hydrogenase expression/formation protein HypC
MCASPGLTLAKIAACQRERPSKEQANIPRLMTQFWVKSPNLHSPAKAGSLAGCPSGNSKFYKLRGSGTGVDLDLQCLLTKLMCLAVPGRVLNVERGDPAFRTGDIDFFGVRKRVNLAYTPEVESGDFVLVHAGFAISRMNREEAMQIYRDLRQIGALDEIAPGEPLAGYVQDR